MRLTFAARLHPMHRRPQCRRPPLSHGGHRSSIMFAKFSAAFAAVCLLGSPAFAQGAKLSDPQIAHIAYTAGVIDVTAAKQALSKSKNKEVIAFAKDMVRDHEAVNKQALDLVKKQKLRPGDHDTSRALTKQAAATGVAVA